MRSFEVTMSDVQPLQPGDPGRLGDHQLEGRLGEGRRGVVFRALHDGAPVAVKLLHTRLTGDAAAREEFLREAMAAQRVSGSRTARPIDAGVAGDWPFLATDLVAGPSLQQMLVQSGRGDRTTVERLAVGIVLGLAQLHKAGIAHLDLKPTNVLIAHDGPVLTDVGVARALTAGGLPPEPGVPSFQAPEQLSGGNQGPSSDMWAWAAIVATAASGKPPFGEDSVEAVTNRVLNSEPELHRLPDSVRDMVVMALNKDPFRRPTAEMVLQTLLRRGLPLPASQLTEAQNLLLAPVPEDPWSAESTAALPALEPALSQGPDFPDRPADPFAGPYLPPAPDRAEWPEPEPLPNMTTVWNGSPPVDVRTPAAARQDQRMIKGLGALVIGVVVGIIVITLLWTGAEDDDPPPAAEPSSAPVANEAAFSGTWRGTAVNQSGVKFSIEVTFADARQATAKIGVGNCSGRLTRTGGSGQKIQMSFTRTGGHCTPGDVTVADPGDGSLTYSWVKPGSKRHHYEATLRRS
ncbi:serine/threonine-protein kinase [Actinocorallia sp. B10E7]|uniref:serine/threonine protein kinase n=1 Tax=Actinocorallia sp. B10E7 TaxID=3153558 RepID=UPI00325DCE3E